jgi:phospholipid transport system transporter-binding protein
MSARAITQRSAGSYAVSGPLSLATVSALQRAGQRAFANADPSFEVDLEGVAAVDSAGLALLIDWLAWAAAHQRRVRYINVPAALQSLAGLSEVRELLELPPATAS